MKFFKKQKSPQRQPNLHMGSEGYSFRRSRTLTGTTSATVKPSAETQSQLKTPRQKSLEKQERRRRRLHIVTLVAAVALFVCYLASTYVQVVEIAYSRQSMAAPPSTAQYQKTLNDYLDSHPVERFGFMLDGRQAAAELQRKHPEILGVTISKQWYGGGVEAHIVFRQPILVWQTTKQRFFVDDQGIAFTYDHFGKTVVPVTDQSGISPDAGSSVASQQFIRFLGKMVGVINAGGKGKVVGVIIPPSTREIDLQLEGRAYPIKTHIDRDPLQQAEDVIRALAYLDGKGIVPQYVDARVGGKAFYR